jgi:outer membrane receptor for Fe3+-dicitrate
MLLKTPTPVIDVPQSLSITSATDIELRGFDSIGDIVDYTPGVNMNQGEGHRDAVVFRGIRSTSTSLSMACAMMCNTTALFITLNRSKFFAALTPYSSDVVVPVVFLTV